MILLGICSDAYENGIQFLIFFFVGSTFMTIFMNFTIIPVFHESEVSTLSEVSSDSYLSTLEVNLILFIKEAVKVATATRKVCFGCFLIKVFKHLGQSFVLK